MISISFLGLLLTSKKVIINKDGHWECKFHMILIFCNLRRL